MKHIFKCQNCNSYTLKSICIECSNKTMMPKPPKFSPEDKYGSYRRKAKMQTLKEKGLI